MIAFHAQLPQVLLDSYFDNNQCLFFDTIEFGGPAAADEDDEEALMQRALELSMLDMNSEGGAPAPAPASEEAPAPTSAAATTEAPTEAATMDVDEDDEVNYVLPK
jgi:hypothetical protein